MTIALRFALVAGLAATTAACGDKKPDSTAAETAPATTDATAATPAAAPVSATAPAGQDWTQVVAATPEGGFRMGNPDAKVKLVEFASLTCPHCREFHEAALSTIKSKYVASGNVSYEFRNFVLNGPDFAASLLARCQGPQPFFGLLNAFFTDQATWTEPFIDDDEGGERPAVGAGPGSADCGAGRSRKAGCLCPRPRHSARQVRPVHCRYQGAGDADRACAPKPPMSTS